MAGRRQAFTLIELLVVIAVIAVLIAILIPALNGAKQQARMVTELAAGRQLGIAYVGYSIERYDTLIKGYTLDEKATNRYGQTLAPGSEPAKRWPWRLAAYMDHGVEGSILTNDQLHAYKTKGMDDYTVSVFPSFGLNYWNLGGNTVNDAENAPGMIIRMSQAKSPARLIVFASARVNKTIDTYTHGFFRINAPTDSPYVWSSTYTYGLFAEQLGNVDPRWKDKAVITHLDGHGEAMGVEDMRDMTRWNNAATGPDWVP